MGRSLIFDGLKGFLRLRFPFVQCLTTGEFAQIVDSEASPPLILDARSEEEYAVSHLREARRVDINSDDTITSTLKESKDRAIVVYCSVGYRSAKVAQQLKKAGFNSVFNLEGGLFQWANEQRPLVRSGQPTQQIHPYNSVWGILIKKRDRASLKRLE